MEKVMSSILTNDDGSPSVSELALEIAKEFEQGPKGGHAEYVYICPTGYPTIGWGHVVLKGEKFNEPMTREEADELLLKDMNKTAARVYNILRREPSQDQFDALVSMAFNTDNEEALFANTNYFLDRNATPGRLVLNTGSAWPVVTRNTNGIEIIYTAGYGPLASDVPSPLRTAIKQLATHWYENREVVKTQSDQNQAMAPLHVQSILNRYQVKKL